MEQPLSVQLLRPAAAFLTGCGLGMLYQLLGFVRRRLGGAAAFLCDAVFCAAAGLALFLLGMGPGQGSLRLSTIAAAAAGAAAYFALAARTVSPAMERALSLLHKAARLAAAPICSVYKILRAAAKNLKNIFSRLEKRITIAGNRRCSKHECSTDKESAAEENADEIQKVKHIY